MVVLQLLVVLLPVLLLILLLLVLLLLLLILLLLVLLLLLLILVLLVLVLLLLETAGGCWRLLLLLEAGQLPPCQLLPPWLPPFLAAIAATGAAKFQQVVAPEV